MSWYIPPGLSFWDYVHPAPASPTPGLSKAPTPGGSRAPAKKHVVAGNVHESTPQPELAAGTLKCCSLADGLEVRWKIDRDRLAADVSLKPPDGSAAGARLTTTRPIGELTVRGKTVQAEVLAAMDVLRHHVYLKGWAASLGRRREIDKVLN